MKKIVVYSSFLLLIGMVACKKEKQEPPVVNSISAGGYLSIDQYFSIDHDTVQYKDDIEAGALFTGPNVIDYLSVDSVSMNGTPLLMNSGLAGYYQAPVKLATTWAWHVKGNNGIPNFDYINTMGLPSYTAFASLPDTVDLHHDFVISLKSLTNATFASIQINGGSNPVSKTFSLAPGTISIQIPAAELTSLTQSDALVEIVFDNETIQQIGDREFTFQNSILIGKRMKIQK